LDGYGGQGDQGINPKAVITDGKDGKP